MNTKRLSWVSIGAACLALCAALLVGLAGCDNLSSASTLEDLRELTNPAPKGSNSAVAGDGVIDVLFTKVADTDYAQVRGYRIYWNTAEYPDPTDPAKVADVGQSDTQLVSYQIRGLQNGTQYWVWAATRYDNGRSPYSEPLTATPRARPASPPSWFTASANEGALDLTWNRVGDADSYSVYWSGSGGGATPPEGAPSSEFYADRDYDVMGYIDGLDNGTSYTLWIQARNSSGGSDGYTQASGVTTPAAGGAGGAPGAVPGTISLAPGDGRFVVSWDAVKVATAYRLYYSTTSTMGTDYAEANPGAGRRTGTISGLTNGTPYWVWVVAVNGSNEAGPSASKSSTPYPPPPLNMSNRSMVIGTAAARFPNEEAGKGDRLSRKQETALADLVADSMYEWAESHKADYNVNQIDFAFTNGGVIATALAAGPIKVDSIIKALHPEGDKMSIVTLTGTQVKRLFNERVAQVPHSGGGGSGTGAFGQVSSHVRYTIDYHGDSRGGVMEGLTFNGEPFEDSTNYTIVTNTYLVVENGDGYGPYLNIGTPINTGKEIAEAVCEWIYNQDGTPITPKTDGRITLVNTSNPAWH